MKKSTNRTGTTSGEAEVLRHDPRPHTTEVVAALQAELDAEFPLPHPGYRVGQIWLVPVRGGLAQVLITGVDPSGRVYTDKGQAAWNSWDDSEDLLCDAFLLFDPISPASAPWSPT